MAKLKDLFSLASMVNQSINQLRKNLVKPSQVKKIAELGKKAEELATWLFGLCRERERERKREREREAFIEG